MKKSLAVVLPFLWVFVLWALAALGTLSLSTLSPIRSSLANLAGALALSFLALFVFMRRTGTRERMRQAASGELARPGDFAPLSLHLALAAVFAWVAMGATRAVWNARLEAFKRDLKARGLAVSLAEFQENLPDDRYAEPALAAAVAKLRLPPMEPREHPGLGAGRWSRETFAKETATVERLEPALIESLSPLTGKYSRYMKVDFLRYARDPLLLPIPRLLSLTTLGQALRLCASWRAFRGDLPRAWGHVRLIVYLSNLVASERSLIAKMVALSMRGQAVQAVAQVLVNRPGAVIPDDLAASLRGFMSQRLLAEGMKTEVAASLDMIGYFERGGYDDGASLPQRLLNRAVGGLAVHMGLFELNGLAMASAMADLQMVYESSRFGPVGGKAPSKPADLPAWPYFLAAIAMPQFSPMHEKEWSFKAWDQLVLVASEASRFRAAKGRWPKTLDDLSLPNDLARDVSSGAGLGYALAGSGFDLCGAGPRGDRKDAKGDELCLRVKGPKDP